jgi:hypothetical protein
MAQHCSRIHCCCHHAHQCCCCCPHRINNTNWRQCNNNCKQRQQWDVVARTGLRSTTLPMTAAQATWAQPKSRGRSLSLRGHSPTCACSIALRHRAVPSLPLLPLPCCQRCPFCCPLPLRYCHCHCCPAAVAAATAMQCPLLCRRRHCHCSILSAAAAAAAQATRAQPARDCKGAAQATRAQPKSRGRSPSLQGSIPSHAQLLFDCCVYSGAMPLFAAQCVRCRRLFGGTSHIKAAIIKRRDV